MLSNFIGISSNGPLRGWRSPWVVAAMLGCSTGCAMKNDPAYRFFATGGVPPVQVSSTGGGGGASGAGPQNFSPLCADVGPTAAGLDIKKGAACTAQDPQHCYRTCGPQSVGFKAEDCGSAGIYVESNCQFPLDGDYSCFAIPDTINMGVCPATTPKSGQQCSVPECLLCNVGGNYYDSNGNSKAGYCVCGPAAATGARSWSCASSTAWPCPLGKGC